MFSTEQAYCDVSQMQRLYADEAGFLHINRQKSEN